MQVCLRRGTGRYLGRAVRRARPRGQACEAKRRVQELGRQRPKAGSRHGKGKEEGAGPAWGWAGKGEGESFSKKNPFPFLVFKTKRKFK